MPTRRRFAILVLAFVASLALARSAQQLAAADLPARLALAAVLIAWPFAARYS